MTASKHAEQAAQLGSHCHQEHIIQMPMQIGTADCRDPDLFICTAHALLLFRLQKSRALMN